MIWAAIAVAGGLALGSLLACIPWIRKPTTLHVRFKIESEQEK